MAEEQHKRICSNRPNCLVLAFDYRDMPGFVCCCFCKKYKTCDVACRDPYDECKWAIDQVALSAQREAEVLPEPVVKKAKLKGRPKKDFTTEALKKTSTAKSTKKKKAEEAKPAELSMAEKRRLWAQKYREKQKQAKLAQLRERYKL